MNWMTKSAVESTSLPTKYRFMKPSSSVLPYFRTLSTVNGRYLSGSRMAYWSSPAPEITEAPMAWTSPFAPEWTKPFSTTAKYMRISFSKAASSFFSVSRRAVRPKASYMRDQDGMNKCGMCPSISWMQSGSSVKVSFVCGLIYIVHGMLRSANSTKKSRGGTDPQHGEIRHPVVRKHRSWSSAMSGMASSLYAAPSKSAR
mmetsp:Transcript_122521/g.240451  ORF Transcript_122521/g.240451 Transcript_122521/m.240451 type:complete len:201 (+) Transcript_122521:274-876(+)